MATIDALTTISPLATASPGNREYLDPDARRRAPGGAHMAARQRRRMSPCRQSSSTSPIANATSPAIATPIMHPYVAGHGYACVRVDLRGSGDSDGVLTDEYMQQELDDGCDVIAWLSAQPWCSGRVGMIGISWGGFNGLQIAALRPPALGAVISLCSTDDRYADDIHHMGGCLLGDNLSWASVMFSYNSLPPDPEIVGERWRKMWFERLEGSGLWLETWLRHQRRDAYWQHGSIAEDYGAMNALSWPSAAGPMATPMPSSDCSPTSERPRKGLIGPWSHKYPHIGVPGPAIGFLQESRALVGPLAEGRGQWRHGRADAARLDAGQRAADDVLQAPPRPLGGRNVLAVAEHRAADASLLARNRLVANGIETAEQPLPIQSPLTTGLFAGKWCSYAAGPDLAHDQRQEDGGALIFESDPLDEQLEILGAPEVELTLTSSEPIAMLAVRLSDVAPDQKVTRVTYGLLNLTHRTSREQPEHLVPGEPYRVRVRLNHIAQVFPRGHRLRLAVSTTYWPLAWPSPQSARPNHSCRQQRTHHSCARRLPGCTTTLRRVRDARRRRRPRRAA